VSQPDRIKQSRLNWDQLKLIAAQEVTTHQWDVMVARVNLFKATLKVGDPNEIQANRIVASEAFENYLDTLQRLYDIQLNQISIDPDSRHVRP
jgi:hypothetical protein